MTLSKDEIMEKARPLTPRSERARISYGSFLISPMNIPGLCPKGKCLKKENHRGGCWPD